MMINKNTSQKTHFWKVSLLLPFLAIFIFCFNVKTEAKEMVVQEEPQISGMEVSVYVTKESDKKALRSYERLFKQQGITLHFEDIKFSEGLLTNVAVSFKKESTGATGNLSLKNPEGITPLLISTNGKEVTMTPTTSVPERSKDPLAGIGNSPLFILGGKEYKASQLQNKHIQIKGAWQVLKPEEAKKRFGNEAKDGAIIIAEENIVEDFKAALKDIDLSQMPMKQIFINVREDQPPFLTSVNSKAMTTRPSQSTDFEKQEITFHQKPENIIAVENPKEKSQIYIQESKPLVIVDGKIQEKDFDASEIDPTTIQSVTVLKDKNATEKYGEKGKNGVIEINLVPEKDLKILQKSSRGADTKKAEEGNKSFSFSTSVVTYNNYEDKKSLSVRDVGSADPDASQPVAGASKPLYVVDGKQMPKDFDPTTLSADNIESMTVLKGDKATEKYGERGVPGVILIITKK